MAGMEENEEKAPRPVAVWVGGTLAYAVLVLALGLILTGINPDSSVFPPLLTALAGLFVATAINVRPASSGDADPDWNRFQVHVIVVAITSMVLSIGLVMCALAFPGELIFQLAFWGAALAILIGAAFLLAVVWERLSTEESPPSPASEPEPKPDPDPEPEPEPEPEPAPEAEPAPESGKVKAAKKELRRAPQTDLVAATLKKSKKTKKPAKKSPKDPKASKAPKKPKKKDSKKKK